MTTETMENLDGWYLIEQMGHKRLAGYVTQITLAGQGMLRVEVPGDDTTERMTQLIHPGTLYALTPIAEELARTLAARFRPQPVSVYDLPMPATRQIEAAVYDDDEERW